MKNDEIEHARIARRVFLANTAILVGATALTANLSRAAAEQKLSYAEAQYQGVPKGTQRCEVCANFQAPNECAFVKGEIKPDGWCQLFSPKT